MKDAITNFKSELNMMDEKCYAMPKYTSESPEVQKACDAMNNYLKASITYKMTNQECGCKQGSDFRLGNI